MIPGRWQPLPITKASENKPLPSCSLARRGSGRIPRCQAEPSGRKRSGTAAGSPGGPHCGIAGGSCTPKMAAAAAPGPRAPVGAGGGPAASSSLSMERIQSLTDLADLEAAYSRLCEEEVRGPARRGGGAGWGGPRSAGRGAAELSAAPARRRGDKESQRLAVTAPLAVRTLRRDVKSGLSRPWGPVRNRCPGAVSSLRVRAPRCTDGPARGAGSWVRSCAMGFA